MVGHKLSKVFSIYREDGFLQLCRRAHRHLRYLYRTNVLFKYHERKGDWRVTVGDSEFSLATTTRAESTELWYCTQNEEWILHSLKRELQSDDVFWDIGANIGIYTLLAGTVLTDGAVVSFEPYPPNVKSLRQNLDRNGIEATVVEKALGDSRDEIDFVSPDDGEVSGSAAVVEESGGGQAEVVPGDALVRDDEVAQPNIVKIDVEGAEIAVIDGLEETLSADECRTVYCEVHLPGSDRPSIQDFGGSFDDVVGRLREYGFGIEVTERGVEKHVIARK